MWVKKWSFVLPPPLDSHDNESTAVIRICNHTRQPPALVFCVRQSDLCSRAFGTQSVICRKIKPPVIQPNVVESACLTLIFHARHDGCSACAVGVGFVLIDQIRRGDHART